MNDKTIFPAFFNTARFDHDGIDLIIDAIMRATKQGCENKPIFSSKFTLEDVKKEAVGYGAISKNGLPYVKFTIKPDNFVPTPREPRNDPGAYRPATDTKHEQSPDEDDDIPF